MYCGDCSEATTEALEVISKISGIYKYSYEVTPTNVKAITYDDESWKPSPEEKAKEKTDISRESEIRQSKTKRVKNYLKKCKNVLGSRSATLEVSSTSEYASATSSWYLEEKIEQNLNECEINELEEVFEDAQDNLILGQCDDLYQVANIVEVKGPSVESAGSEKINDSDYKNENDAEHSYEQSKDSQRDASEPNGPETASPNLKKSQVEEVGNVEGEKIEVKEEVEAEITLKLILTNNRITCMNSSSKLTSHLQVVCG